MLAAAWKLPPTLVNAIALHHRANLNELKEFSPRDLNLIGIVFAANQLAKLVGCPADDPEIDLPAGGLLPRLGLPDSYAEILKLVQPEVASELRGLGARS